jgi:hypothetical protein
MSPIRITVLAAALSVAGCTPAIMKTPVNGTPAAIARLAGEWQGDYSSAESGRRGVIAFRLRAGADTAEGDVIMQSRDESDPASPNVSAVPWDGVRAMHQPLAIRFVFVSDNEVSGVLSPYRDPDCGCMLTTTFRGTLKGDVIEGTFRSDGDGFLHIPTAGQWRVKRYTP